jgi:MFS family permease
MNNSDPKRKQWMLTAIATQTMGMHGALAFRNSLLLLYMLSMGLTQTLVIAYLAILGIGNLVRIPVAYFSDRWGKKRFGSIGNILGVIGFIIIACAGFSESVQVCEIVVLIGILIFSCGDALFGAAWFPMLRPIVPAEIRGRFFGKLRITWQLAGLVFSGIAALALGEKGGVAVYQVIMGAIALLLAVRSFFYSRLPELEKAEHGKKEPLLLLTGKILRQSGYASFAAYIFLLMIFTANTPNIFSMVEREVMNLASETVVWLANIGLVGALIGYFIGGRAVDRFSTKPVFLICHFGYAMLSFLFLMRGFSPTITMPLLGICHFAFGFVYAASSIAITTEIIALMPKFNQALANSILTTMLFLGIGCSSLLCAGMLKLDFLKASWVLWGFNMSNYDAMLLGNCVMVTILITALGLVPSVIRKAEDMPR